MPFDPHKNFAYGVVSVAPSPAGSGTTLQVQSGQGADFPAASSGDSTTHYNLTVWPADALPLSSNAEIVRVTNRSGDVFTITRTQESTSARSIVVGDQVAATITNKTLTDIEGTFAGLLSGIAGSNTTYTSGTVTFTGVGGGVTVSSNTGQRIDISVAAPVAQTVQTQNLHNVTLAGNTAGALAHISSGTMTLAGGNNITLSQNGNAVTVSGANAQTGISGIVASDATYTSGTVTFTGVGGGVTVNSNTGQRVDISVAAQTVQTQNLHNVTLGGNTAGVMAQISSGTMTLAGGNNITVSQNGNAVTISGANVGGAQTGISGIVVSDATYTSGTVSFSNAGNITISSSVNGATQYIRLSGNAAQTAQSAIEGFGVSNTGATAGNTGISTGVDWVLAGSQSITLSQSTAAGTNTIWIQHPAWITTATQSTQFLALTLGGNTAGTTTFHATNNASLFLNGGNNITLSGNGSTVTISAAAQTNQTLGLYAVGNTTGESSSTTRDARTLSFHGAGNVSVGYSAGSVVVSGGTAAAAPVNFSAGTTSGNLGSVVFSDSNGVSFGLNGSTITATVSTYNTAGTATTVTPVASANSVGTVTRWAAEDHRHAGIGGVGISTAGNTSGTTGSQVGTYWFQGGNNITLSQITSNNGSHTLVVSGVNGPLDYYENGGIGATVLSNPGQMTLFVFPFQPDNGIFPGNMSVNSVFLNVTQSVSTAATWTNQLSIAFYTSVNSTQLTRVFSGSTSWGTNAGNMNINDSFGGTRWLSIHSSNFDAQPVFSEGVRYWCAIWNRTSNNAGSMSFNLFGYNTLGSSGARSGVMGVGSVANSTLGWKRFLGIYSVTFSSGMPAALAGSDINKSVAQVLFLPQVILNNVGTNIV